MRAALRLGPKTGMPAERTASATPSMSGASGPTTTRPMLWASAHAATSTGDSGLTSARSARASMPPLPGAT